MLTLSVRWRLVAMVLTAAMLAPAGCSSSTDEVDPQTVTPAPQNAAPSLATAADRVDELFKLMTPEERQQARADALGLSVPDAGSRRAKLDLAPPSVEVAVPVAEVKPPVSTEKPAAVPSDEDRARGFRELASAIVPAGSSATLLSAMQLAAAGPTDATAATKLKEVEERLTPTEKNVLTAFRSLLTAAADPVSKSEADWAKLLADNAGALTAAQGVMISRALLCKRVEAFGRYVEFDTKAFLAGRAHPVLVYAELDRFAYKAVSPQAALGPVPEGVDDTRYEVELAQRIEVYTDSGTLVHLERETRTRDVSRNKRRELYTVQRIELSPTLGPGAYTIKVKVRDLNSGAEAEQVIALSIVANAAAAVMEK